MPSSDEQRLANIRESQQRVVQPDSQVVFLLDRLAAAEESRERQHREIVEAVHALCAAVDEDIARADPPKAVMQQMIAMARAHRLRADAAEARIAALVEAFASSTLTDHEGQCVACWSYVEDAEPERHADRCLIETLRRALNPE
jgi:hypothetical protein